MVDSSFFRCYWVKKTYAHAQRGSQDDSHRLHRIKTTKSFYLFSFNIFSTSSSEVLRNIIFLSLSTKYKAGIILKSK